MKGGIYLDEEAPLVREHFAVVVAHQEKRKRFAETAVELAASAEAALALADPAAGRRAACVMGPSRSSEGVRLYYLVRWL